MPPRGCLCAGSFRVWGLWILALLSPPAQTSLSRDTLWSHLSDFEAFEGYAKGGQRHRMALNEATLGTV